MKFILVAAALSALFASAFAAEAAEGVANCPIKAGTGTWDYNEKGNKGPSDWGNMDGFGTCKTGEIQAPANWPTRVKYASMASGPKPSMASPKMAFSATPMNFAWGCPEGTDCGSTTVGGVKYNVANIHMHSPSEHTLGGRYYPLEAHIVHVSEDGKNFAVIATMFDYPNGRDYMARVYAPTKKDWGTNPFMAAVLDAVSNDKKEAPIPLGSILEPSKGYCSYTGSLTTPPCTEGVVFFMSMHVPTISRRQVHAYSVAAGAGYDGNNRPLQPLNGREITCHFN